MGDWQQHQPNQISLSPSHRKIMYAGTRKYKKGSQKSKKKRRGNKEKKEKCNDAENSFVSLETGVEDIAFHSCQGELILEIALKPKKCFIAVTASV